jgi:capsular exopolysaccharide synthesis family protein
MERLAEGDLSVADRVIRDPMSPYAETIRRLRASIDQAFRTESRDGGTRSASQTLLVTSTLPEEGKSTTALALARTYAMAGKSVLLIDCDLRRPSLHGFVGADNAIGILDYLRAKGAIKNFSGFWIKDGETGPDMILGRGRSDQPTDQLLTSAQFEHLMTAARDHFDTVILDTSPLLPVVDARYILHHADAVIMCVKWVQTRQSDLRTVTPHLRDGMRDDAFLFGLMSHSEGPTARRYYNYGYY